MAKVLLMGCQCERCAHEWLPREKDVDPIVCPSCKSPYWNKPRRGAKASMPALPMTASRRRQVRIEERERAK